MCIKKSKYNVYTEGIAIHLNLIKAKTYYMHNKNIVYRITNNSSSNNLDPFNNILSFFNYSYCTLKEILTSKELQVLFKLKFTYIFAIENFFYTMSLIKSNIKNFIIKFF